MILSSVAAELCLAAAAYWGAARSWKRYAPLAPAGFLLFAAAATFGALTYAGIGLADGPHSLVTLLTEWAGLGLIATGLMGRRGPTLIGGALLLAVAVATRQTLLINIAALALMIFWRAWGTRRAPWPTVVAALLFALAGLAIGTHGQVFGLPRVDLYHLVLAAALLLAAV